MKKRKKSDPIVEDGSASFVSLFEDLYVTKLGIDYEMMAASSGYRLIAGVDEVGRGCVAGPVVAAACILDLSRPLPRDLNDSKQLTAEQRERIAAELQEHALAYAIGEVDAPEIDRINILEATKQAMLIAIESLSPAADYLLVDALELKQCRLPQKGIIKGDSLSASIAAASVIAKTYRDELMTRYHDEYPHYGFDSNKGYGCPVQWAGLREYGPTPIHRLTFNGVVPQPEVATPLFAN